MRISAGFDCTTASLDSRRRAIRACETAFRRLGADLTFSACARAWAGSTPIRDKWFENIRRDNGGLGKEVVSRSYPAPDFRCAQPCRRKHQTQCGSAGADSVACPAAKQFVVLPRSRRNQQRSGPCDARTARLGSPHFCIIGPPVHLRFSRERRYR